MQLEKIKDFYQLREEYFAKQEEIAKLAFDIRQIKNYIRYALCDTIDNGLEESYMLKVANEYNTKHFDSQIVQDFLQQIDKMFLSDVDTKLKENLEVTKIKLDAFTGWGDGQNYGLHITSSAEISFIDVVTNRSFTIVIPLRCSSTNVNIDLWDESKAGLYRVFASLGDRQKMICYAFDYSKISVAVSMFLSGMVDDEIKSETFITYENISLPLRHFPFNDILNDDESTQYDWSPNNWQTKDICTNIVPSCITDVNEVFSKCVNS